jgi:hypothetical protein
MITTCLKRQRLIRHSSFCSTTCRRRDIVINTRKTRSYRLLATAPH